LPSLYGEGVGATRLNSSGMDARPNSGSGGGGMGYGGTKGGTGGSGICIITYQP
jgi:hypothetical protein